MTNAGLKIVQTRIIKAIADINTSYNRRRIFSRAKYIYKNSICTWSDAMKQSWYESKQSVLKSRDEVATLKARLSNLATPIEFHQTEQFKVNMMHKAHDNGQNLNL